MNIYGLILVLLKKLMKIIKRKRFIVGGYMNIRDYSQYSKKSNHKIVNFKEMDSNDENQLYKFIVELKNDFRKNEKPIFYASNNEPILYTNFFYCLLKDCMIKYYENPNNEGFISEYLGIYDQSAKFLSIYEI